MTFLVEYQSIAPFPPLVLAKLVEAFAEPYYIAAKMRVSFNDIVIYILFAIFKNQIDKFLPSFRVTIMAKSIFHIICRNDNLFIADMIYHTV